jgi:deoxyribodipyrimidine photo-lyase
MLRGVREGERLAATTSRLSPYLRFGVLSPLEVADRAASLPDGSRFLRKLAWRDFFAQLVWSDPTLVQRDVHPARAPRRCNDDLVAFESWRRAGTGVDIVDAAMRQLLREGWMPNRARLIAASYLTRTLGVDWRKGADHFDRLLVDGDPSSNSGNWQWVAGTGANPRRGVALSMDRQTERFDADGAYRRRYRADD